PVPGPDGPAYEGRPLDRPHEEIVDQGAHFDAATLMSRRAVLGAVGVGARAVALAACSSDGSGTAAGSPSAAAQAVSGTAADEIPEETNGPYPADGTQGVNVLEESG